MRFFEFRMPLKEEARIQHAEDILFWEGSAGAARALESIRKLESEGHKNVTVKWDGSPAIIFGRGEDGKFVLTDKSGFGAKGYDGRPTSGKDLESMLLQRPGARNPDPKKAEGYAQLASNMRRLFDLYEKATPEDLKGFFKGDLLYSNTPKIQDGKYVFTPNIVTYTVDVNSPIGKRIGKSVSGVVIHRLVEPSGMEVPLPADSIKSFQGNEVFVVPPVTVVKPAQIDNNSIKELETMIAQYAQSINKLLNQTTLQQLKLSDFSQILYTYTNNKVDNGMQDIGNDFMTWLSNSKVSKVKQQRIVQYIADNKQGFEGVWKLHTKIRQLKDDIVNQFDNHDSDVKATIGPDGPAKQETHGEGGEGYVLAHPEGDIKLVPREYFSKANRSVER